MLNYMVLTEIALIGLGPTLKKRKQACSVNTTKEIQCVVPQEVPLALCYSSST